MKKTSIIVFVILGMAYSVKSQDNRDIVIDTIDQLLENKLQMESIHNVFLSIYSPSRDFEWHSAKGKFNDSTEVTLQHPFYAASIGKTFTAVAIGILVDQSKIQFNDPVSKYLSREIMDGLHVLNEVDYGDSIKLSHLLQHTSGLPDYFGETQDGSPSMFELILSEPSRFWEPEELIEFSKTHFQPSFPPGSGYYYTDTEYVLLGMIIEEISGMKFSEFLEKNVFIPLEMSNTYLNQRSDPIQPTFVMAEMYAGEYEISTLKSLSADWAGGAIVSTGKDLITFQAALMSGELVSEATLNDMQDWKQETQGMTYGYGLRKIAIDELDSSLPELEVIGHSGLNGTSMYYCPSLDIYLSGTLNQLEASKDAMILIVKVLMLCTDIE